MIEIFCYGAELFSTLRHYSKPTNACQLLIGSPETVVSAIRVLGVVDDCSQQRNEITWLNDRDLLLWRRAVLLSGTILSPTNACQATYRVPETVVNYCSAASSRWLLAFAATRKYT
jgi:hypothetical protein